MIQTTLDGKPALLVNFRADWNRSVTGRFEALTFRSVGLDQREDRGGLRSTLLATLNFSALLTPTEAAALRAGQAAWANQQILCPFWPSETLAKDFAGPAVQSSYRVWYEPDWSNWSINSSSAPDTFTPTQYCLTAPLVVGVFADYPIATPVSGEDYETASFKIVENGDEAYALRPKAVTLVNGSTKNGLATPLLNVPFAWGKNTSQMDVRIKRGSVGFGRFSADAFYAQTPRTKSVLNFSALDTAETAYILRLFADRLGSVNPFWCLPPHGRQVAEAVYGRFFGDSLEIEWEKPALGGEVANLRVEFISLPTEDTVPVGETFGDTIGPRATTFWAYEITDGTSTWRFTSFETSVEIDGELFDNRPITHKGRIVEEINLQLSDCQLEVHHWGPENPFARLVYAPNSAPLTVKIYEGSFDPGNVPEVVYTGIAMAPRTIGKLMTIKLRQPGDAILSGEGPRCTLQPTCPAVLGDERCKLNLNDLIQTRALISISGAVALVNGASMPVASYFQNGYITRTVGDVTQHILINDSYNSGGNLALVFTGIITDWTVGESWQLTPSCDGYYSTCVGRFNNGRNHRGCPNMPNKNPSMFVVNSPSGSKKG